MNSTKMVLSSVKTTGKTIAEVEAPVNRIGRLALESELEWMRQYLGQLKSPVVFCHNDLQEGNILIRENAAPAVEKLVIIDFEYSSYNFRGFDLANHFCEWMYDYTVDKYPKYSYTPAAMPSMDEKLHFIRCYLETVERESLVNPTDGHRGMVSANSASSSITGPKNEFRLLREADCYILASHFFWGLWGVVNAPVSSIPFGYWVSISFTSVLFLKKIKSRY